MTTFPAYGMAGIGTAAAIGFVLALSLLNNDPAIETGNDATTKEARQQLEDSQESALQTQEEVPEPESGGASNEDSEAPGSTPMEPEDKQEMASNEMAQQRTNMHLSLSSLGAYSFPSRELIGSIDPDMAFPAGKSFLLQANFTSPKSSDEELLISMEVRGNAETIAYSSLQGRFADSDNISVEVLFSPENAGDYTILIFVLTPSELVSTPPIQPLIMIPVKVV
ncbi:MAG: hypothetical protein MN733_18250 [Nitrososphaera sp.]|nr:hypothetical protein [Nitrososphaera sp.]